VSREYNESYCWTIEKFSFFHNYAIGSIRANELRAEPNSDLMLDKELVSKVICCIDDCEVVVEEYGLLLTNHQIQF